MNRHILLTILLICVLANCYATKLTGIVYNETGKPLAYASITVKETGKGTTTNESGAYLLDLSSGNYTISVQYIGYKKQDKKIHISNDAEKLDFKLEPQTFTLNEVVVKSGGKDPAYEIIRNAIKKREEYRTPLDSFTCQAYIKMMIKTRGLPKRIFGQKIDSTDLKEMGVDSLGRGIIALTESVTKIAYKKPEKLKMEVLSGRESGSGGYGFNFPTFINFYDNNVEVMSDIIAPRGFVSPIANDALSFYNYKFLGSFFEDGKEVNRIKVIPKRNYEPLFSGTIEITEGDWRIFSLDLQLTKQSQLQMLDTMHIRQIHQPITSKVWRVKDQVTYFTFNLFGINAIGNLVNIYNDYDLKPKFPKNYFNNVIVKYDTAVNRKTLAYWDSIRPVPLQPEEAKDFKVKDSVYKAKKDSGYSKRFIDSLRAKQGNVTVMNILWSGVKRGNYNPEKWTTFYWKPLLKQIQYNTVEGLAMNAEATIKRAYPAANGELSFTPHVRYGFSNGHLNAWGTFEWNNKTFNKDTSGKYEFNEFGFDNNSHNRFSLSGGKRINQFNKDNPISPLFNSIVTLFFNHNYMKIYENYFTEFNWIHTNNNGLKYGLNLLYEDRIPIENTTDFSIIKYDSQKFTPNYPYEKISSQFPRHQAVIASAFVEYQPGQKFIEFPNMRMLVGSKYPTFTLNYQKGIEGILGSDVNFDKWSLSARQELKLNLWGQFNYRVNIGGFLNTKSVYIQDYRHFNGNQIVLASQYLNSFQLAPYYANSTTASFYTAAHIEHHFNGAITNKIPLFKKLNWNLVAGSNAFYVNSNNNYVEVFGGIENIFKLIRVDVVGAYLNGTSGQVAVRLGLGGILGGKISFTN